MDGTPPKTMISTRDAVIDMTGILAMLAVANQAQRQGLAKVIAATAALTEQPEIRAQLTEAERAASEADAVTQRVMEAVYKLLGDLGGYDE